MRFPPPARAEVRVAIHFPLRCAVRFFPGSLMREYRIAAIPGDGIGIEVIAAGLQALQVLAERDGGFRLKVEHFPWSSAYYQQHGYYIPEGGLEKLKTFDAIFF